MVYVIRYTFFNIIKFCLFLNSKIIFQVLLHISSTEICSRKRPLSDYCAIALKVSQCSFLVCYLITMIRVITILESIWHSVITKISVYV